MANNQYQICARSLIRLRMCNSDGVPVRLLLWIMKAAVSSTVRHLVFFCHL